MNSFELKASRHSLWGRADVYAHVTGAKVVHLRDRRAEQGFAIGFPAPVPDESGLAHVLEHMIFRGARGHDDDQLYTALKSGSLASHLNASTGPEMTAFHLASPVAADAHRLQAALLEAVFHPLLRPMAFRQEVYDPATRRAGVVMNEMIGHLGRPEAMLEQALRRALFPAQALGRCYGGDPEALAGLDLAHLRDFHQRFYHPRQALVLLTGAGRIAPRLALLAQAFAGVPARAPSVSPLVPKPLHAVAGEVAGLSGLAWCLPADLDPWHRAVLAHLVQERVGRDLLLPRSGLVEGTQPYLALLARRPLQIDLAAMAHDLTPAILAQAAGLVLTRRTDPEGDFRLPAGLQIWPALAAAHLRGESLLSALSDPPCYKLDRIRGALCQMAAQDLMPLQAATLAAFAAPNGTGGTAPVVPARRPFAPLPLRHLPDLPPVPVVTQDQGIFYLEAPEADHLRLCLWFRGGHLPLALRGQLPVLAASAQACLQLQAQAHHGDQVGLLLEARVRLGDLQPWLARLQDWLAAPPLAMAAPSSLPLRAECRLRAAFSPAWAQVAALDTPAPEAFGDLAGLVAALRPHGVLACSDLRARAALLDWQGGAAGPKVFVPEGLAPRESAVAVEEGLFTLGLGLQVPEAPALTDLALRAIEADYLWPLLRVAGGAYGLRVSRVADLVTMVSLRDPQGLHSLQLMRKAGAWLAEHADAALLHRAQLAAAAQALRPQPLSQRLRVLVAGGPEESGSWSADLRGADPSQLRRMGKVFAQAPSAQVVLASGAALAGIGLTPDH